MEPITSSMSHWKGEFIVPSTQVNIGTEIWPLDGDSREPSIAALLTKENQIAWLHARIGNHSHATATPKTGSNWTNPFVKETTHTNKSETVL